MTRTTPVPADNEPVPDRLAQTGYHVLGEAAVEMAVSDRAIVVFDGLPGLGKTTTARHAASQIGRPSAVVLMPPKPLPLGMLRLTYLALTGTTPKGGRTALEDEILLELADWDGLLVVDEAQNLRQTGLAELMYLHERSGRSFAMLLVGHGIEDELTSVPPLDDRVLLRVRFRPLVGVELLETVGALDPRLAGALDRHLVSLDQRYCAGRLRGWNKVVRLLDMVVRPGEALDDNTVNELVELLTRRSTGGKTPRHGMPLDGRKKDERETEGDL